MEQKTDYARYKTLFYLLTAAVFIWGVLGTLDIRNIPFTGYVLSPDRVVTLIRENSPAAAAGLRVGDIVTKIDGIAVVDFGSLIAQPRPAINSSGSVSVKRGTAEETLTLKYGSQPMTDLIAAFGAATLTGLAFLILGLLVYLKHPTRLTAMFCSLSLLFAVALFNTPYFASSVLRRVVVAATFFGVAMLFAVVLNYCLAFPASKKIVAGRAWLRQAIYVVAGAFGVMVATIFITTPVMTPVRSMLLSLAFGIFFGGYILLSVIAVVHSYIKASTQERSATGLNLMLLGMLIGFGPVLLSILVHTLSPHMGELPGERFYNISLIAIPIGLAMALSKLTSAPADVPEVIEEKPKTIGARA